MAKVSDDTWFIANNLEKSLAIREYKKRFDIEEMFNDFKAGGFYLEDTWTHDLQYAKTLYLCICIAYLGLELNGLRDAIII